MDNIRPALFENGWQSAVHAVIKSWPFAQVVHFNPGLLQQTIEVATQPTRVRNDYGLITLTVQPPYDMNGYTLGATRAQHWNDMDDSDLLHDLS
jgi:hypothetical protein